MGPFQEQHSWRDVNSNLFRQLLIIVTIYIFLYSWLYFFLGAPASGAALVFGYAFLTPLTFFLEKMKYHDTSRYLFILSCVFYIYAAPLGVRFEINALYYYIPEVMIPLLLFRFEQKLQIAIGSTLPILGWAYSMWGPYPPISESWLAHSFPVEAFKTLNPLGSFLMTGLFISFFTQYLQMIKDLQIAEMRQVEFKLAQSSRMASLGEMAGGIAHEINNPLAIIVGIADLLKSQIISGEFNLKKAPLSLDIITNTSARIAKIIRGLLSFSRSANSDPKVLSSIQEIIDNTLDLCKTRFAEANIQLETHYDPNIKIICRPYQICQILTNLLNNSYDAIEFLPEKWVRVSCSVLEQRVHIEVTDSGNGIREDIVEKIMLPFFTTKPIGKGTGLGLSISLGIASEHYGKLHYVPTSPHTQFILELPFEQPI